MKKESKYILVCGGAGYIGSYMTWLLAQQGYQPLVYDNFSTGHAEAVSGVDVIDGDVQDIDSLRRVFAMYPIAAVIHFAAKSIVSESVQDPLLYFANNVGGSLQLLQAMNDAGVNKIVFSSTAAVYGQADMTALTEDSAVAPINPYGTSKRQVEQILAACADSYGLRSASLRYFNAAGAHPDGILGEAHSPETHLIPNVIKAVLEQRPLYVYGDTYTTPDGTCVRDYIHIHDLCTAHLRALLFLEANAGAHVFNLGNGHGFSVKEVIETASQLLGQVISYEVVAPRDGDPPMLVADATKAKRALGWSLEYTELAPIIETAIRWHQNQRYG